VDGLALGSQAGSVAISRACVVFNAGAYRRGSILEIAPEDFELISLVSPPRSSPSRARAKHGARARFAGVAHVIIDGQIEERPSTEGGDFVPDGRLAPEAIAQVYLDLHRQQRSAWSQELDLRPWVERF